MGLKHLPFFAQSQQQSRFVWAKTQVLVWNFHLNDRWKQTSSFRKELIHSHGAVKSQGHARPAAAAACGSDPGLRSVSKPEPADFRLSGCSSLGLLWHRAQWDALEGSGSPVETFESAGSGGPTVEVCRGGRVCHSDLVQVDLVVCGPASSWSPEEGPGGKRSGSRQGVVFWGPDAWKIGQGFIYEAKRKRKAARLLLRLSDVNKWVFRWYIWTLTCRNMGVDPGGPGRCHTAHTAFSEEKHYCGSCDTCLRESGGHHSDPCSDEGHMDGGGLPARAGCCFLDSCIYGPSASLLDVQENKQFNSFGWGRRCLSSECDPRGFNQSLYRCCQSGAC